MEEELSCGGGGGGGGVGEEGRGEEGGGRYLLQWDPSQINFP